MSRAASNNRHQRRPRSSSPASGCNHHGANWLLVDGQRGGAIVIATRICAKDGVEIASDANATSNGSDEPNWSWSQVKGCLPRLRRFHELAALVTFCA